MMDDAENTLLSVSKEEGAQETNDQVVIIQNLENLIKNHLVQIEKLKVELKQNKDMVEDILLNDSTYKDHSEKAKEANKLKALTRKQIMNQPNARALQEKIKEAGISVKELDTALSDYVREYQRLTGVNEIEGADGEVREIVFSVKLIKKSSRK